MKKLLIMAAILVAASPMVALAQGSSQPASGTKPATKSEAKPAAKSGQKVTGSPSIIASGKATETLTIIAIDKPTRVVTLKSAGGDTIAVKCGPEVRNFAQLAVGDEVVTTYTESYSIHIEQGGEAEETKEVTTSRAKVGAQPGGSVYETRTVKAKIEAIDKAKGTVTLSTMTGEKFTVTPANKANLDKIQVGNMVVVTEKTGSAISVNKPKAAAPAKKKK